MSETETETTRETRVIERDAAAPTVENPPPVVPYGHADAPPPVPLEPVPDPETQAYVDAHVASPDPRDPGADTSQTAEDYQAGFSKPPDPRDPTESLLTPGELWPRVPEVPAEAVAPPVNIDIPYLSQAGAVLTCTMGNWEGEPYTYEYLWAVDGLEGATGSNQHALVAEDVGREYTCVVTAINAAGPTAAPPSNSVIVTDLATRETESEHKPRHRNPRREV